MQLFVGKTKFRNKTDPLCFPPARSNGDKDADKNVLLMARIVTKKRIAVYDGLPDDDMQCIISHKTKTDENHLHESCGVMYTQPPTQKYNSSDDFYHDSIRTNKLLI